ncbi:MAG: TetR/AcrR family transcriptional regulator [Mycobacteriaceae bacterium]|nr:TetR/AcrR family transcriptional regulator [Mycobacteriaceae bacterium]MBV9641305.1 TetR/AcrR family transcriptional regulator [Mycobacteriaceae bacterium]
MVRQARSEATRQKIVNAAVDLFGDVGYAETGFGEIIERAQMTKGALYYHFDSKEQLAASIIEEGGAAVLNAFGDMANSAAPALETMIHGSFVVAELMVTNKVARTAVQLGRALAGFSRAAARAYGDWLAAMAAVAHRAAAEGDLRGDVDPESVADCVTSAMLGAELTSSAVSRGADLIRRVTNSWEILLPAIADEGGLEYFREFLARESLRHLQPTLTID